METIYQDQHEYYYFCAGRRIVVPEMWVKYELSRRTIRLVQVVY